MILLAVWLILTGLLPLLNVRISATVNTVLAVIAIAAGVLILLRRWDTEMEVEHGSRSGGDSHSFVNWCVPKLAV